MEVTCSYVLNHSDNPFAVSTPSHNSSDARHLDRPVGCRHFEDVAGVAENRCFERGRNSIRLYGQTKVGRFSRPGYTVIPGISAHGAIPHTSEFNYFSLRSFNGDEMERVNTRWIAYRSAL